jgi:hypothetical protein
MSLRKILSSFLPEDKVNALVQEYHKLCVIHPGWRIGQFVALIRGEMG